MKYFLPAFCSSSGFAPENKSSSSHSVVDATFRADLPINKFFILQNIDRKISEYLILEVKRNFSSENLHIKMLKSHIQHRKFIKKVLDIGPLSQYSMKFPPFLSVLRRSQLLFFTDSFSFTLFNLIKTVNNNEKDFLAKIGPKM